MKFPELNYHSLKNTRDTIQTYAQLLSDVKGKFTSHQKNWEEFSLKIYAKGLTTTPIPVEINDTIEALDLNLNLIEHKLKIFFGKERLSVELENQSISSFANEVEQKLHGLGIDYKLPENKFNIEEISEYSKAEVGNLWTAVRYIYFLLLAFKGIQIEETSSINFWPHHFDVAMLLFSGKLIPDQDPNNWDNSREQMNFGFSSGDQGINEPYFYITSYPFKDDVLDNKLPAGAYWHTEGWNGAVLKYSELRRSDDPGSNLLYFLKFVKEIYF